jgi:hypothetical protein
MAVISEIAPDTRALRPAEVEAEVPITVSFLADCAGQLPRSATRRTVDLDLPGEPRRGSDPNNNGTWLESLLFEPQSH